MDLSTLKQTAQTEIQSASSLEALEDLRLKFLGKKGSLTEILKGLGSLPPEERKSIAQSANIAKQAITQQIEAKYVELEAIAVSQRLQSEKVDITLPGRIVPKGSLHPVTRVLERIQKLLGQVGFQVETGPEIEDEFHNFTALNIAEHHPARAMHDTFYIEPGVLLRTHTSPVQVRAVELRSAPLKIIAPGRVYRCDFDQTHTPMFHQVEGLVINKTASFSELKHLLTTFLQTFFEDDELQIRFRPSYFPFTEPSAEVDVKASHLGGGDWLEVLGCGMVHPNVLENMGLSADQWQGYAFGLGVERLAMLRYGVKDLRLFFDNELSFLKQFQG